MTTRAGGMVLVFGGCWAATLVGCGGEGAPVVETFPPDPAPAVSGPAWWGFGRDAQHSAIGAVASQDLNQIVWRKRIDLEPQYTGDELFIHYGSPVITDQNTVVLPVKVGAAGGFRIEARSGGNGALIWSTDSDYRLPSSDWPSSYNLTLSASGRLYAPGAGGKLLMRDAPDASAGTMQTAVFYGADLYAAAPATYDDTVMIATAIASDPAGNAFFGFTVAGTNPAGLAGGVARVGADGSGAWVAAGAASGDPSITKVAIGSAPALSADAQTLYVAVNRAPDPTGKITQSGYLLALDSQTLATRASVALTDPSTGAPAQVDDSSTASPTVGPDGDVYFGVFESGKAHHYRGWLLHFDADLAVQKIPGSFGWDDTASIVPSSMVASYAGGSPYLLMTKYNNYGNPGIGGDGQNRIAILDPGASQLDPYSTTTVMKEVLTILGPTADPAVQGGVKEWCINSAAVDPITDSVLLNSEDGVLYRWDLATNQLSQHIRLSNGLGQAYTPTAVGADGAVYAISNATLFVVGR